MFSAVYIEEEVAEYPRVHQILRRIPDVPRIHCERYGEVFNPRAQNFRLQKQRPALILAKKYGKLVLPTPTGYGFNQQPSYYFSHMLNCVYDCRYCFLQGMYRSANYVLFVNFEDFADALAANIESNESPSVYYSGYDCDSLALEPISRFCEFYLPLFARIPQATLEIRTKSTQIRGLLETKPLPNVVIAMSFTAHAAAQRWEHKVPTIEKRLDALCKLQQAGWQVALRFEPLICEPNLETNYRRLFDEIFSSLNTASLHSVSTGMFRMPVDFHKNIVKLYPDEALYARPIEVREGLIVLSNGDEDSQLRTIQDCLAGYISAEQYYHCASL